MPFADIEDQCVHHVVRHPGVQPFDLYLLQDGQLRLRHDLQGELTGHGFPLMDVVDMDGRVGDRLKVVVLDDLLQGCGENLLQSFIVEGLASDAHLYHPARCVPLAEPGDVRAPGDLAQRLGKPLGKFGCLELDLDPDDILFLPQQLRLHLSNSFRAFKRAYYTI